LWAGKASNAYALACREVLKINCVWCGGAAKFEQVRVTPYVIELNQSGEANTPCAIKGHIAEALVGTNDLGFGADSITHEVSLGWGSPVNSSVIPVAHRILGTETHPSRVAEIARGGIANIFDDGRDLPTAGRVSHIAVRDELNGVGNEHGTIL